jgi:two-component system NtrC family sensor kinase
MRSQADLPPRILVIDDNQAILDDFRKILPHAADPADAELAALEGELFGEAPPVRAGVELLLDTASQGQEGVELVAEARAASRPYAVAFVDMRMPPGWDGLETAERLWQVDPALQIVICSAFSDYGWDELRARLGDRDGLLIIKKPFDPIEVMQAVHALTSKWRLAREAEAHVHGLEAAVLTRTVALEAANRRLSAEIQEREQVESELRLAQKLEAIGQLAAGVAHEINTPIQFVGDSLVFVRESLAEVFALIGDMRAAATELGVLTDRFDALAAAVDLPYVDEHVPVAIARMEDGIARVAGIVRSMKELTHNGPRERVPVDLNRALENALQVTANSYKYVADLELALAPLPPVLGYVGDLGQVFINLIVNAAHAIEDRVRGSGGRGRIRVATRVDGGDVVIDVGDTGTGIPEPVRARVFDAFYTTKPVGRGTGQGLAIASRIVVKTHGGAIAFDSEVGVGTTFHVRLPIDGPPRALAN